MVGAAAIRSDHGQPEAPINIELRCPRCGYDVRGAMHGWAEVCPIMGRCTECGVDYHWGDVLHAGGTSPPWSVEHAAGIGGLIIRTARTAALVWWPWPMWGQLKMEHTIRPGLVCAALLVLIMLMYVVFAMSHGILLYSLWLTEQVLFTTMDLVHGAVLPWSSQAPVNNFRRWATAPIDAYEWYWQEFLRVLMLSLVPFILAPLSFFALPMSRREAKVRWAHIARIALLALFVLPPIWGCLFISNGTQRLDSLPALHQMTAAIGGIGLIMLVPWMWLYWGCAAGRYLRMRHAPIIGLVVMVLSVLTTFTVIFLISVNTTWL